jgi:hypothetical protein
MRPHVLLRLLTIPVDPCSHKNKRKEGESKSQNQNFKLKLITRISMNPSEISVIQQQQTTTT